MDPDAEAQLVQEENQTKWRLKYDMGSSTRPGMEDQMQQLIKAVTNSSEATTQAIWESNQEWFAAVREMLNSIYDVVSKRTLDRNAIQEFLLINTEPQARNV